MLVGRPRAVETHEARLAVGRIDDEARSVVEPVVEASRRRIRQLEAQPETAVGERQAADVEAEALLGSALPPPDLVRRDGAGCQYQPCFVAKLPREPRRSERRIGRDQHVRRQRLARRELTPLLVVAAPQHDVFDLALAAAVLAEARAPLVGIALLREQPVVLRHRLTCRPVEGELPIPEQDSPRAETLDGGRVVGDEHDRPAALLELENLAEALALELLIADGEHLVEQEHVDLEVGGNGEAEPHVHARGIRAHGHVDESLELREGHDLLEVPVDRGPLEAEDRPVQVDVLAARELRMETGAELEQRSDPAADLDPPLGRLHDPGDQPEEGRLAGAVPADQADGPARLDRERDA